MKREICPACGKATLDLMKYQSMMVVSADRALFQLRCPRCGGASTTLHRIPPSLFDRVQAVAVEVGAGMGRDA